MKRTLKSIAQLFLVFIIGSTLGFIIAFTSFFISKRKDLYWEKIDYLPFTVEQIFSLNDDGVFWVSNNEGDIYQVSHPCPSGEICWKKFDTIQDSQNGVLIFQKSCETKINHEADHIGMPLLFVEIKTCLVAKDMDTSGPLSRGPAIMVISDKNELWIWDNNQYDLIGVLLLAYFVGSWIGLFSFLIAWVIH